MGWASAKGKHDIFVPATAALPAVDIHNDFHLTRLSTVRLRFGVTVGERSQLYVTAGFAGAHVSTFDQAVFPAAASNNTLVGSGFRTGWTAGGGIEHAFTGQWSAKAEYLYAGLTSFSTNSTNSNLAVQLPIEHQRWMNVQVIRIGLNYRFGGAYPGW
jgi:outer membrane immunogenic protein